MEKIHPKLLGDAGEHYVAFELARRGVSPALLSSNTKGADILATVSGRKVVSIQVKASAGANNSSTWAVGKHKPEVSDTFYYIFMNIWRDYERKVEAFIVPSKVVLQSVDWFASMPQFRLKAIEKEKYKDNWQQILNILFETVS
ncbi:MAG: hypothetical protein A2W28_10260 [Gammaproteobacteria bacterium RBG_16_51_14]|nr:MAG: hypothetical protein A2W28_10260 [Gammaproteobacteria bacterium RBG_16_51_14]